MADKLNEADNTATHDSLEHGSTDAESAHVDVPETQFTQGFGEETNADPVGGYAVPETQFHEGSAGQDAGSPNQQDEQQLHEPGADRDGSPGPAADLLVNPDTAPLTPVTLFSRQLDEENGGWPIFTYGRPTMQPLDMRGTRKAVTPAAPVELPRYTEGHHQAQTVKGNVPAEPTLPNDAAVSTEKQNLEGRDDGQIPPPRETGSPVPCAMQISVPTKVRRKRKKRTQQSSNLTAPAEDQPAAAVALDDRQPQPADHAQQSEPVSRLTKFDAFTQHGQDTDMIGHHAGPAQQDDITDTRPTLPVQPDQDGYHVAVEDNPYLDPVVDMVIDEERAGEAIEQQRAQAYSTNVPRPSMRDTGHHRTPKQPSRRKSRHVSHHHTYESGSDAVSQTMSEALEYVQDKHQREQSKASADVEKLNKELEQTVEAKDSLQAELNNALQQNDKIATMLEHQKSRSLAYNAKLKAFQKFMSTIKTDLDDLHETHEKVSHAKEQLVHECQQHKLEHEELCKRLQQMAAKTVEDREQGLEASRELKTQLDAAQVLNKFLETYLSDSKGSLVEERDRRSQVEAQLVTMTETLNATRQNHEAVLQKLEEMNTVLSQTTAREQLTEFVEKVSAALRGLDGQQVETAINVASVIETIKALSEELTTAKESGPTRGSDDTALSQIQTCLREAFKEFKTDLDKREQLTQQDAAQQESFAILQDRYQTTSDQCEDLQAQMSSLRQNELQLQNTNSSLKAKLTALENVAQPGPDPGCVTNGDQDAIRTMKLELRSKTEELQAVHNELNVAHEQLQSFRIQLEDVHHRSTNATTQRQQLQGDVEARLDQVRSEMKRHSDKVLAEKMAEYKNRMRELKSDNELLSNRVQPLQLELAARQAEVAEVHKTAASVQAKHEEALVKATKDAQSWKQKAEMKSSAAEESMKRKLDDLSHKLAAEQTSNQKMVDEKTALDEQLENLQSAVQQAQTAHADVNEELKEQQQQHAAALAKATEELATANGTIERHNAGLKHLKDECDRVVEIEKQKGRGNLEALQHSLSQAQQELQQEKQSDETFRADIERAWKADQEDYEARFGAISQRLAQAETHRDQTMAENERLRKQIQELASQRQPSLPGVAQNDAHDAGRPADDVTPAISNKENDPPRPRKKVDRQALTVTETAPIPIPEALRPDSRQKSADDAAVRGPVVEKSQLQESTVHVPATQYSHDSGFHTGSRFPLGAISNISDEMLGSAASHTQHLGHIVEETQFEDNLPSFAAFNSNTTMAAPKRKTASTITVPPATDLLSQSSRPAVRRKGSLHGPPDASQGFAIYEDQMSQTSLPSQAPLQNSLTWTDAEMEKYTYRKPFPPPNSASKMAPRKDDQNMRHQPVSRSNNPAFRTPPFRAASEKVSDHHSSTPDFINDVGSRHKQPHHTSGGYDSASKRRISRTNSNTKTNQDPRLHARNMAAPAGASKRKAETPYIVEGYEHERKKRKEAAASKSQTQPGRYPLRTNSHPSINDLPQMPRSSSSRGGPTQSSSRMRTLGGSTSRAARGGKKASKSDQFNARFSQELR